MRKKQRKKKPRETKDLKAAPDNPPRPHPMQTLLHAVRRIEANDREIAGAGSIALDAHRAAAVGEILTQIDAALDALATLKDEAACGYPRPYA